MEARRYVAWLLWCGVMMFNWQSVEIFLCRTPVDMRKSIDGLGMIVSRQFHKAPENGSLYVFCNRGKDKLKILYWERNGFCLWYKRLEKERFILLHSSSSVVQITEQQLRWLLDGLDYTRLKGHKSVTYSAYY